MTGQTFFHRSGSLATLLILSLLSWNVRRSAAECSQSNCTMRWPADYLNTTCRLTWCKNKLDTYSPFEPSLVPEGATCYPHNNYLVNFTACPTAQTPGAPGKPTVYYPYDLGFSFIVHWDDPTDRGACNLLGYRLTLMAQRTYLQDFAFAKNLSALSPGKNKVKLMINPPLCRNCLLLEPSVVRVLFTKPYQFSIDITSLPLKSDQPKDIAAVTSKATFKTNACDSPEVDCLHGQLLKTLSQPYPCNLRYSFNNAGGEKSELVCECVWRQVFNISAVELGNSTVNVSYGWQRLAPTTAKVEVVAALYQNVSMYDLWSGIPDSYQQQNIDLTSGSAGTILFSYRDKFVPGMVIEILISRADNVRFKGKPLIFTNVVPASPYRGSGGVKPVTFSLGRTQQSTRRPGTTMSQLQSTTPLRDVTSPGKSSVSLTILVSAAGFLVLLIGFLIVFLWRNRSRRSIKIGEGCSFPKGWNSVNVYNPGHEKDVHSPRCYISYSRFTNRSNSNAVRLCDLLNANGVSVVLDVEHLNEIADNVPTWVEKQIAKADCVIVLLDEAYPWNHGSGTMSEVLKYDSSGELHISRHESMFLQSEQFCGKSQNIIPVFVSEGSCIEPCTCVPLALRCTTLYRLPADFSGESDNFQSLLLRILTKARGDSYCIGV